MWSFTRAPQVRKRWWRTRDVWKLSKPLIRWSKSDSWTVGDSFENTLIVGATGSGKTSGSGRMIAEAALKNGYGALVLLAKDDREFWKTLCRRVGRSRDLIFFGPKEPWRFNFIDYEMSHGGRGAGLTENVVSLFSTIQEMCERNTGQGGGRDGEGYWRRSCRQLSRNAVDLLMLSTGRLNITDLYQIVISTAENLEEMRSERWRKDSFCFHCLCEAERSAKTPSQVRDLETVADYFMIEFPALSDKTRSIVVSTFSSMVDVLNRGVLRDLFCEETNITPQAIEDGHIVLVDLPVKQFGEVGLLAQAIWKYMFQTAIERRNLRMSPRPVMLFADEAQFTVSSNDMQFLSTCRSSRVATVYLTQNISNFYAALGGQQKATSEADSMFGNLNTKIFHANGDPVTNSWAANLIGQSRQCFYSANSSHQGSDWFDSMMGSGNGAQTSGGVSEQKDFEVQPSEFTKMRTGGRQNRWIVDGIVFRSGQVFKDTGCTWRHATFKQRF